MPNSEDHANRWLQLLASQRLPGAETFRTHVAAGRISSLCTCGCHGFGFSVPADARLDRLTTGSGLYCEIAFASNAEEEINVLLFADERGYFCEAKITLGSNVEPMPDTIIATATDGIWPSHSVVPGTDISLESANEK